MKTARQHPVAFAISITWLIFFALQYGGPLILFLRYSFAPRDYYGGILPGWTSDAWSRFAQRETLGVLGASAANAIATTLICILLGVPASLAILGNRQRHRTLLLGLIAIPLALNSLLVAYAWVAILSEGSVLHTLLLRTASVSSSRLLFSSTTVILAMVGSYLPFFILTFYLSLERIDPGFLRVAAACGATPWQQFRTVLLPLTKSGFLSGVMLVFLPTFTEFVIPDLLGGGRRFVVGNLAQYLFYEGRDWPLASALLLTVTVVLLLCTLPFMRQLRGAFMPE